MCFYKFTVSRGTKSHLTYLKIERKTDLNNARFNHTGVCRKQANDIFALKIQIRLEYQTRLYAMLNYAFYDDNRKINVEYTRYTF